MKKFRTAVSVIIMLIAGTAGFFIGAALDNAMGGASLFSMIAGIALCDLYTRQSRKIRPAGKRFFLVSCGLLLYAYI